MKIKSLATGLFVLYAFTLMGCAAKTEFGNQPPADYANEPFSRVYDAPLNKVWAAAIASISEDFFVLDNIEKDSHIITLSFSSQNPEQFIDCGQRIITNTGGMSKSGTQYVNFAKQHESFYLSDGTPHPKEAVSNSNLTGKANIVFTALSNSKTKVTINARYVLSGTITAQQFIPVGLNGYMQTVSENYSATFNTNQDGKLASSSFGSGSATCKSRRVLEKSILDGIQKKL